MFPCDGFDFRFGFFSFLFCLIFFVVAFAGCSFAFGYDFFGVFSFDRCDDDQSTVLDLDLSPYGKG